MLQGHQVMGLSTRAFECGTLAAFLVRRGFSRSHGAPGASSGSAGHGNLGRIV